MGRKKKKKKKKEEKERKEITFKFGIKVFEILLLILKLALIDEKVWWKKFVRTFSPGNIPIGEIDGKFQLVETFV